MRVRELLEILEYMNGDDEIRIASQPSWPMEHAIYDAVWVGIPHTPYEDEDDDTQAPGVVYIVEGEQLGYLPEAAQQAVGWD